MERRLFSDDRLERIHNAALRVLAEMGMAVHNRTCLEALERFGAKVDYPQQRAFFQKDVIGRMMEIVLSEHRGWQRSSPRLDARMCTSGGGTCPFYLDEERGERRRATEADCIEAFKIVDTSPVASCEPPVSNGECDHRFEAIRCLQLGIETLRNAELGGTDLFFPEQVAFVAELGKLYRNDPGRFLPWGNCPTSPLTVSKTIADLALAKSAYHIPYAVPTMPVAGMNAPLTPAGTAVIGVAEILGGYVLAKAMNPKTPVMACALTARMDMKTGTMTYVAPEVFASDVAIVELFECRLRLPCVVLGMYVDARLPGMRAMQEKLMRSVALGMYAGLTGYQGTLDQGRLFSPTQLMLDAELQSFLAAYTAEPVVDDDTLGLGAVFDVGFEATNYMTHEHTLAHLRQGWEPAIFRRASWVSMADEVSRERAYIERARETWRENLKKYEPPNHSDEFLRELRRICDKARKALVL